MARTIYQDGAEDTESNLVSYEAVSLGGLFHHKPPSSSIFNSTGSPSPS